MARESLHQRQSGIAERLRRMNIVHRGVRDVRTGTAHNQRIIPLTTWTEPVGKTELL